MRWLIDGVSNSTPKLSRGSFVVRSVRNLETGGQFVGLV